MRSHKLNKITKAKGRALAHYLNTYGRTRDGRRLIAMLGRIRQVMDEHEELRRVDVPERKRRGRAIERELGRIDREWRALAGYPVLYGLDPLQDGRKRMAFTYDPAHLRSHAALIGKRGFLWELATEGYLHRIRQCLSCKRWIFALKESQKSCSTRCRLAFHRSSPDYKARHAKAMRKFRADEKERELRESIHQWRSTIDAAPAEARRGKRNLRRAKVKK